MYLSFCARISDISFNAAFQILEFSDKEYRAQAHKFSF